MNKRITIIGGAYGSGKTEFAVAYALKKLATTRQKTGLIDLDIVNPYFRSRDLAEDEEFAGITFVSTPAGLENADMPALSPRIYTLLQDRTYQVVFDVGGDPVGARALGRFNPYFKNEPYDFWVVVNPFRPDTRNPEEAAKLIAGLETASRLQATGLVANINWGRETTPELWNEGLPFIQELAAKINLPVIHHMVENSFFETNRDSLAGTDFFPVRLRMLPPWLEA
ncbi:MAG TPA: hypothetical protein VEC37_16375 [Bacillota bacterium]|nr:hypothetical protein [Bacillota bacterium]